MASEHPEKETTILTKWGPIVFFNGTNYPFFRDSVMMAMAAADALGFLENTETIVAVPAETDSEVQSKMYQNYKKRKGYAIYIINTGLKHIQRAAIVELILAGDIKGSWNKLAAMDQAQNPLFIANVRQTFARETFDPKTQTIRQFAIILLNHQIMISTSKYGITDAELRSILLQSLPETGIWPASRSFAINYDLSFEKTIQHLVIASTPSTKSGTNNGDAVNAIITRNDERERTVTDIFDKMTRT
ncbi:hypothetical protein EAE96_007583 [Botrytis aclada]|nr:hypothetical protein EAE96_007583 [Botrytis aclada]